MEEELITGNEVLDNEIDDTYIDASEITDTPKETEETEETEKTEETVSEKTFTQAELDAIVEKRLAREKRNTERETSKYKAIAETVKAGMEEDDLDKLQGDLKNFYANQGIDIPDIKNERDEIILAKADAEEIIEDGIEHMEEVANKIASKPENLRTTREKTIFNEVCANLVIMKSEKELVKNGIDASILKEKEFQEFSKKFNPTTPVLEIHSMYSKINQKVIDKPKSTGSVKTGSTESGVKEYYTPEEASKLTMKDYDNPRVMKAVENSMTKW